MSLSHRFFPLLRSLGLSSDEDNGRGTQPESSKIIQESHIEVNRYSHHLYHSGDKRSRHEQGQSPVLESSKRIRAILR